REEIVECKVELQETKATDGTTNSSHPRESEVTIHPLARWPVFDYSLFRQFIQVSGLTAIHCFILIFNFICHEVLFSNRSDDIMKFKSAFTLIELLIVVAIIAILAAIAVPNFLEAQVRSKVSRAKADMRSMATALEAYAVDNNKYPPDGLCYNVTFGNCSEKAPAGSNLEMYLAYRRITTPIAYISTIPINVFPNKTDQPTDVTRGL